MDVFGIRTEARFRAAAYRKRRSQTGVPSGCRALLRLLVAALWKKCRRPRPEVPRRQRQLRDRRHRSRGLTGTETGTLTDVFLPTMMNARAIEADDWSWFRAWVQ